VIDKYDLGSAAGVNKIIHVLEDKEIIQTHKGRVEFLDPVFKMWLEEVFRV
jgi:hypothetical protein